MLHWLVHMLSFWLDVPIKNNGMLLVNMCIIDDAACVYICIDMYIYIYIPDAPGMEYLSFNPKKLTVKCWV